MGLLHPVNGNLHDLHHAFLHAEKASDFTVAKPCRLCYYFSLLLVCVNIVLYFYALDSLICIICNHYAGYPGTNCLHRFITFHVGITSAPLKNICILSSGFSHIIT
ncbi:hypothetical protein NQD34_001740 [Periophthalmus magnuspinnatus]|nr:hypothetical protein NQD34_001740 [Periophthalmus magnuspinnatus]